MRIAIIGGTGFVGSYIVDALLEQGHDVSVLVRPGSEHKVRHSASARIVSGTIDSTQSIDDLVAGRDAIIYCVGILRELPRKGITFEATQFDGVANTIDAAQKNGVRRFVLMSANGVKSPGTRYQETKKRAEERLLASDLDATIFRPSVIFGDPRGQMEFATQLFQDMVEKPIPAVGFFSGLNPASGAVLMSPVHVEDIANAFANSLTDDSTVGEIYNLGGPDILSWTEIIRRIAAATGRKKWIIPLPIGFMKLAATLFDWLPFFPVTRDQLTMLAEGNTADPDVIESLIGKAPSPFTFEHLDYLND
jgi:NADH dehydrogenase